MMPVRVAFIFFLCYAALFVLAGIQIQHFWPLLPAQIVTRFNAQGFGTEAAHITKQGFICFYIVFLFLMPALLIGGTLLLRILPLRLINLPHKHYWLAPERKQKTLQKLQRSMTVFSCAPVCFMIGLQQLVMQANLLSPPRLDNHLFIPFFGCFLVVVLAFILHQYLTFRLPEGAQDNKSQPLP